MECQDYQDVLEEKENVDFQVKEEILEMLLEELQDVQVLLETLEYKDLKVGMECPVWWD